jgi:mevalonate pyrophosphate decarboxylase
MNTNYVPIVARTGKELLDTIKLQDKWNKEAKKSQQEYEDYQYQKDYENYRYITEEEANEIHAGASGDDPPENY